MPLNPELLTPERRKTLAAAFQAQFSERTFACRRPKNSYCAPHLQTSGPYQHSVLRPFCKDEHLREADADAFSFATFADPRQHTVQPASEPKSLIHLWFWLPPRRVVNCSATSISRSR